MHPLEGIKAALDDDTQINYAKGCHTYKFLPAIPSDLFKENDGFKVEFYNGQEFEGSPIETKILKGNKFWAMGGFGLDIVAQSERPSLSVLFTGELEPKFSGEYDFEIFSIGPSRLTMNGEVLIDNWTSQDPGDAFFGMGSAPRRGKINLEAGKIYSLKVEYKWEGRFPAVQIGMQAPDQFNLMDEAAAIAKDADAVILIVGTNSDWETEGNDRDNLDLPSNQNENNVHVVGMIIDNNTGEILNGSLLTSLAFKEGLSWIIPFGDKIITLGVLLFAISTVISWSFYGDRATEYLFGEKAIPVYRGFYITFVFVGAIATLEAMWAFGDAALGFMTFPNLISIVLLSGTLKKMTKDYFEIEHKTYNE